MSRTMYCPETTCQYESDSEHGIKIHYGKEHDGTLSGVVVDCEYCGDETRKDEYRLERSEHLFCSTDCYDSWQSENVSGEDAGGWDGGHTVEVSCEYCNTVFNEREDHVEKYENNFCGKECYAEWQHETGARSGENNGQWSGGPAIIECDNCGEEFSRKKSRVEKQEKHFCSESCFGKAKRGESYGWRRGGEWHSIRKEVYKRDNYECQQCGESNVELHAHHIIPVSNGGKKYKMGNLITLCRNCHYNVHYSR